MTNATTEEHRGDRERLDDVAEEERFLFIGRRRRPAGDARPHPFRLRASGWLWFGLGAGVLGIWVWLFATGRPAPEIERVDEAVLSAAVRVRSDLGITLARAVAFLGSVWFVIGLRWITIAVLAVTQRLRHLATFVATALILRIAVILLVQAIGRPRPIGVAYAYGWQGYAHPSTAVTAFAVAAVGASFALAPRGRWRRAAYWVSGVSIAALAVARVYLGVDHPSDVVFAAVIGIAAVVVAFRVFCPSGTFPVTYSGGRAAHLEIDGPREERLREALDEQAGLELVSVEPFGEESSGGSTPLRLRVRRSEDDHEEELFAKLYAESHLRADRWYKLGRTIRYGALEDELAFNSVRQLVEHEDYMLRVMRDARIPTVHPRGFVELEPGREYLILMTFLHDAEEADEDAAIDEQVIDHGLEVVRAMWEQGLAHRDVKPGNVMIRHGKVHLIDMAFGEMRPSPWRQAVDLANMMLVLALGSDPATVYGRATEIFEPEEIAEAFAATRGITMPRELREKIKEDGRDLVGEFRALAPERPPIAIQRWSFRRIVLTVRTTLVVGGLAVLVVLNLANVDAP